MTGQDGLWPCQGFAAVRSSLQGGESQGQEPGVIQSQSQGAGVTVTEVRSHEAQSDSYRSQESQSHSHMGQESQALSHTSCALNVPVVGWALQCCDCTSISTCLTKAVSL